MNKILNMQSHDNAHTHVTGRSEFVDDRVLQKNELYVDILFCKHAKARIKKISIEKALKIKGCAGIFFGKDFHENLWGTIFRDQPLLADKVVNFAGEVVALIAADTKDAAHEAKKLIEIHYEILPAILSITDAISKDSFIASSKKIERGDVESALQSAANKIQDSIVIRGADHFY